MFHSKLQKNCKTAKKHMCSIPSSKTHSIFPCSDSRDYWDTLIVLYRVWQKMICSHTALNKHAY